MHSYRIHRNSWEVFFDCGAPDSTARVLKTFDTEIDAATYVSFLNGGMLDFDRLALLMDDER